MVMLCLAGCNGRQQPAAANAAGSAAEGMNAAASSANHAGVSAAGVAGLSSAAGSAGSVAAAANGGSTIPANFDTLKLVLGGGGGIMPCAAAPCHGVGGMAPPGRPLALPPNDDRQLYANLTSYVSTACGNTKLVVPGKPAQSALLSILKGPCGMTPRMPYGCSVQAGDCIPDEYIAAVAQWIANGAAQP
jgi:hypothetical protein